MTIVVLPISSDSGEVTGEKHEVTLSFHRIQSVESLNQVLTANGSENLVRIFEKGNLLSPLTYFTFSNKEEFYVVESNALPAQKSLVDSASEAVTEKYNALQDTLTGALSSVPVDDIKAQVTGKVSDTISWGKKLLGKK